MPMQPCAYNPAHSSTYLDSNGKRRSKCPICQGTFKYYCRTCGYVIATDKTICDNPAHHAAPLTSPAPSVEAHCQCPACGINLPDKRSTCFNCGQNFVWRCPLCGATMLPTATTCNPPVGCGATFTMICPQLPP
jgi:hypothetical protein